MGKIVLSKVVTHKVLEIKNFYESRDPKIGYRAVETIFLAFETLLVSPEIGRPWRGSMERRELIIPFGRYGFISLYEIEKNTGLIIVLALRHQREAMSAEKGWPI
jgi:plasmid stabilization system protein ParE